MSIGEFPIHAALDTYNNHKMRPGYLVALNMHHAKKFDATSFVVSWK
jgi:hypothetical protein